VLLQPAIIAHDIMRAMQVAEPLRALMLPLRPAPLLLVAIFSVLIVLSLQAGLFGLAALLILSSWFFKYGFVLLDHAAQGRPGAPVLSIEDANPLGEMRPLAYGLLVGGFYVGTGLLGAVAGGAATEALRLLGLAALPAILATHTITGSLTAALRPGAVVEMTRRLGAAYLLVMLVALGCWLLGLALVTDGSALWLVARIALLMLLWLELFAVLGAVIHQRRFEVGFEPEHSPERRRARDDRERDRDRDRFIDRVFAEYRSGAAANALQTVRARAAASPAPLEEYLWMYDRVAAFPGARLGNAVAQDLLPLLLDARRTGDALRIARQRLGADASFRPSTAEQTVRLAELARAGGDRALARGLIEDFEQRFPRDPAASRAQRLAEELGRR
jgi:hypothetical protein